MKCSGMQDELSFQPGVLTALPFPFPTTTHIYFPVTACLPFSSSE